MPRLPAKVYIRKARAADCALLAADGRMSDRREVAAVAAVTLADAALFALKSSEYARAVFLGKALVCLYGVSRENVLAGGRQPWLLGTPLIDLYARQFAVQSRAILTKIVATYGPLENMIDSRNTRTIRWLRFLGFTIYGAEPYGHAGRPFHRFRIEQCASQP